MNKNQSNKKKHTKKTMKRRHNTKKRGGARKKTDCNATCKAKFMDELKQDNKYITMKNLLSKFGKENIMEEELSKALDNKDIQNDEVYKSCVTDCNTNKNKNNKKKQ